VNHVHASARAAPFRTAFQAFLKEATAPAAAPMSHGKRIGDLAHAPIAFDQVSYVYEDNAAATPLRAEALWSPGRGLAITGDNGAGKTTLALLLLGLLTPKGGRIQLAGVDIADLDLDAYRARVAYVPQSAFVAQGAGVAWHMRLFAG